MFIFWHYYCISLMQQYKLEIRAFSFKFHFSHKGFLFKFNTIDPNKLYNFLFKSKNWKNGLTRSLCLFNFPSQFYIFFTLRYIKFIKGQIYLISAPQCSIFWHYWCISLIQLFKLEIRAFSFKLHFSHKGFLFPTVLLI